MKNRFYIYLMVGFLLMLIAPETCSQGHNATSYQQNILSPQRACKKIRKKRFKAHKNKPHRLNKKKVRYAEGGAMRINLYKNDPKSSSRTVSIQKEETAVHSFEEMTLEEKHHIEDDVLKKYHLPEPTSAKHEQIRKNVESHLENFEEETPLKLDPLYFVVDQDEFAFVDMDPFLIAVEYALQGKHLLIEGHTDASGNSDYNVQLSIKRVERIRQLMLDMGVSDDHISVVGYGEEHSSADSELAEDKQLDRRVDFTIF